MANVTDDLNAQPEFQEPPKSRGCLYGCIFVVVGGLAMIMCAGIGGYMWFKGQVTKYTSPDPMVLPTVELGEAEMAALKKRTEAFGEAIDKGETPKEDLILTAEEINALIQQEDEMKGRVFVKIDDGQIEGDVSIPTDFLPGGEGRFFNGKAKVDVSMDRGILIVIMTEAEVNGEKLPQEFIDAMAQQNLAKDIYNDPEAAKVLRNFDSVSIEGDKLILRVRRDGEAGETTGTESSEADGDAAADESAKEATDDAAEASEESATSEAAEATEESAAEAAEAAETEEPEPAAA